MPKDGITSQNFTLPIVWSMTRSKIAIELFYITALFGVFLLKKRKILPDFAELLNFDYITFVSKL